MYEIDICTNILEIKKVDYLKMEKGNCICKNAEKTVIQFATLPHAFKNERK